MDQFRLLWLFAIFYVASVVVGIGYSNKVGDGKSWMSYWNSALPKSPLPSKAVQQLLNLAEDERSYSGIGKDGASGCICFRCYSRPGCTEEVKVKPGLTTYFQEKDLQHLGKTVTLQFLKPTKIMKSTIEECEAPAIKGEDKYCATSLESLIDFTVSKLGKYVQVYATEAENNNENKQAEYSIEITGVQSIGDSSVVCHKESYVYGVFYCHKFNNTRAYMVPLVGADGVAKVKAFAVCHTDTTSWNPKHLAFQVLKIKPGNTIGVCHFLATTGLLWVPM